jgi:hypothetical protein
VGLDTWSNPTPGKILTVVGFWRTRHICVASSRQRVTSASWMLLQMYTNR